MNHSWVKAVSSFAPPLLARSLQTESAVSGACTNLPRELIVLSCLIGQAGWSIAKGQASHFGPNGSHLERYSERLNAVEVNSSFYRHHRAQTYARWAKCVPDHFRFCVKLSKELTHVAKLDCTLTQIEAAIQPILSLEQKLGCLLVQLPPKLEFEPTLAEKFFARLTQVSRIWIACEPRHPSWQNAQPLFAALRISQVHADPKPYPEYRPPPAAQYFRLHGSPDIYKSSYSPAQLQDVAALLKTPAEKPRWVIFDNTTFGHATENALQLQKLLA